ncbi:MAG: hypothetical protein WAW06_04735, partial [bacterium]
GDTTWIQVHSASTYCPGDPYLGHGTEAAAGPGPLGTWCFEGGPGDSCGTYPPWNARCFTHVDVRTLPSEMGINYWHVDTYRADQQAYCGDYALWCGSAAQWQGQDVECGTWQNPPGYSDNWNCVAQLTLPPAFAVANGCTLLFDPRYDTECRYDYLYVDFWNGTQWKTLATFNATSNNPGGICGVPPSPNPDYFGNTDTNRLTNCNWQTRANPNEPAFKGIISHATLVITSGPKFRWRFASDGAWSDGGDGRGNTDGAAFIDNIWVWGDSQQLTEDFESGALNPAYWSLPRHEGVTDQWHIAHDPDPPYEGGDGGSRTACVSDSSYVYRARPDNGYSGSWRNGWYYRLMTPAIPITNSGCVLRSDEDYCGGDTQCDYAGWSIRFFDATYGKWCPWTSLAPMMDTGCMLYTDIEHDPGYYFSAGSDSFQYAWNLVDGELPGDVCYGKHKGTDFIVDNVAVGFYDKEIPGVRASVRDLLHDTFFTGLCGYNSYFDTYSPETLAYYWGGQEIPWENQLVVSVWEEEPGATMELFASRNQGGSWVSSEMTLRADWYTLREYSGTVCPADFGDTAWVKGDEIWYYV